MNPEIQGRLTRESKMILNSYSHTLQKIKAIEELAELIQALAKDLNPRSVSLPSSQLVREEIADCLIMLHQMYYLYGPELVDEFIEKKLDRMKVRDY